ncbi:MAG: protein kinase [Parafannyhessea sp.]|uniref:protein kinase domain-containing protein n=1 Tax=Parafannyhessea sp. TaxID=2847324 RepID=UPI003F0FB64A
MTEGSNPEDEALLEALDLDDSFSPVRTLAEGEAGMTELVVRREPRAGEPTLLVRKRMPTGLANERAWHALREVAASGAEGASRLPRVREIYRLPDALVVVYDFVDGPTLAQLVRDGGPLEAGRAVLLVRQLCQALAPLHAAGVVHRDVTPGNVVVASDGAHLIDLGIARVRVEGATHDTTRLGTWGFAAPEQYGFAQTDARSDVFSLGRLLAYALTALDPSGAAFESAADSPQVLASVREVINKATAFEPSARYQSVGELSRALEAACPPQPSPAAARPAARPAASVPSGGSLRARFREAAVPAASPAELWHAFRSAGVGERVACVLLALFAALGAALLVYSSILMLGKSLLDTFTAVLCLVMAAWFALAFGWEPACCLTSAGRYAVPGGRLGTLLLREGAHLLRLVVAFVAIVLVVAFALPNC